MTSFTIGELTLRAVETKKAADALRAKANGEATLEVLKAENTALSLQIEAARLEAQDITAQDLILEAQNEMMREELAKGANHLERQDAKIAQMNDHIEVLKAKVGRLVEALRCEKNAHTVTRERRDFFDRVSRVKHAGKAPPPIPPPKVSPGLMIPRDSAWTKSW